jgi:hypothetical protein
MGVPIMVKPEPLERLEFESPVLAAAVSGLDMLVFHTHRPVGTEAFTRAGQKTADLAQRGETGIDHLFQSIVAMGYRWGQSDGN